MAKTTAPLLSFGANGQIAKTAVYATWKGRPYVRRHVIPANPRSTAQTETRNVFTNMNAVFKQIGPIFRAPWTEFAKGQVLLDRNAFVGKNTAALRNDTDLADMVFSPGAKGGLPPDSVSATGGVGTITVTINAPTVPSGWTLDAVQAAAIKDQDPSAMTDFSSFEGEDTTDPKDTVSLSGLSPGTYRVGGWTKWTKPDGSKAYGPGLNTTAVVT